MLAGTRGCTSRPQERQWEWSVGRCGSHSTHCRSPAASLQAVGCAPGLRAVPPTAAEACPCAEHHIPELVCIASPPGSSKACWQCGGHRGACLSAAPESGGCFGVCTRAESPAARVQRPRPWAARHGAPFVTRDITSPIAECVHQTAQLEPPASGCWCWRGFGFRPGCVFVPAPVAAAHGALHGC